MLPAPFPYRLVVVMMMIIMEIVIIAFLSHLNVGGAVV